MNYNVLFRFCTNNRHAGTGVNKTTAFLAMALCKILLLHFMNEVGVFKQVLLVVVFCIAKVARVFDYFPFGFMINFFHRHMIIRTCTISLITKPLFASFLLYRHNIRRWNLKGKFYKS